MISVPRSHARQAPDLCGFPLLGARNGWRCRRMSCGVRGCAPRWRIGTMRYGEEETSAILRRAAEMQARRLGESSEAANGLSLAEIERAAADIGIRPEFIRAAVAEQTGPRIHFVPRGTFELRRVLSGSVSEALFREM